MISYQPLWDFMEESGIKPFYLRKNKILSPETLFRMQSGKPTNLDTIDRICSEFNIPIERVVAILNNDGQQYTEPTIPPSIQTSQYEKIKYFIIEELKKYREENGMSINDVALHFDLSTQTIRLWEKGAKIKEDYIEDLKTMLKVPDEAIEPV